jgi:preprotein translocase subunit SecA
MRCIGSLASLVNQLQREKHYSVDEKSNSVSLTDEGVDYVEKLLKVKNMYEDPQIAYHLDNALKAKELYKRMMSIWLRMERFNC